MGRGLYFPCECVPAAASLPAHADTVIADLSMLAPGGFWIVLDHHNWVHPYDEKGRRKGAKICIVQYQNGRPVAVYPESIAIGQAAWPKTA